MPKQMKFRVKCNGYRSRGGVIYRKGDVVFSTTPLHEKFTNGFELLEIIPGEDDVSMDFPCFYKKLPAELAPPPAAVPAATKKGGKKKGKAAEETAAAAEAAPAPAVEEPTLFDVVNTETKAVLNDRPLLAEEADSIVAPQAGTSWKCVDFWRGQTVFVLGGGPSLKEMDLDPIKQGRVLGVNDAYILGDWVSVCFFGDWHWLLKHREQLAQWPGLKVTNNPQCAKVSGLLQMNRLEEGFGRRDDLGWGCNSGYAAVCLAALLGAETIVLLGFDMKLDAGGQSNWHPNNLNKNDERTYKGFMYHMELLGKIMKRDRPKVRVVNATPGTALEAFPKMTLEEVLRG